MKNVGMLAALVLGGATTIGAQGATIATAAPSVDQVLSLKRAGSPKISPDGRWVAYTVRETNWDDNAYETEIWLAEAATGATRQLTNAKKSSQSPAWSPDGATLAFISDRTDKRQVYLINPRGGEAEALTTLDEG
ncbi:MAG: TolB family protein, partial [Vicinamibacterales bacterium]